MLLLERTIIRSRSTKNLRILNNISATCQQILLTQLSFASSVSGFAWFMRGDNDEYCLDNSIDNEYARVVSGGSPMHWSVKQDSLEGNSHCRVVIQKCGVKESPRLPVSSRCIDGLVEMDERRFLGRVWSNRSVSPRFWPNLTF